MVAHLGCLKIPNSVTTPVTTQGESLFLLEHFMNKIASDSTVFDSASHTPGPWRYIQRGTQVWGTSVGGCQMLKGNHLIADIRGWGHLQYLPNGEQVQDANGRLIAAAPELLSALNAMLTHMGMDEDDWNKPTFDQARAAIAKATGGAV